VILVDDQSKDDSVKVANAIADANRHRRLTVLSGRPLPRGWTGKVWAMKQGSDQAQILPHPPRCAARALRSMASFRPSCFSFRCFIHSNG
jgi:hypothetical protein